MVLLRNISLLVLTTVTTAGLEPPAPLQQLAGVNGRYIGAAIDDNKMLFSGGQLSLAELTMATWPSLSPDGTFRNPVFFRVLGENFIDVAFKAARNVKLYMNDYNVETVGKTSDAYLAHAKRCLSRGTPVQSTSFQAHLMVGEVPAAVTAANYKRFTDLGLEFL
ncbi:glycoside hydrolase superfamily [Powellomyces hirtus]|nr:glycoside hydrolase superfamily [Powellomyces hirtus]